MINDILDYSKIEAGKLELSETPFPLRETLEDTLKTLALRAHAKRLELACRVAPEVPDALFGDPHRLRQVVVNLVGNAIKFTERGEVVIEATLDGVRPGHDGDGETVVVGFRVADTGIGIPEEKLSVIFQPFEQADNSTTRRYGGTGLGLAISTRLVDLMGGTIRVESEVGRGSAFESSARCGRRDPEDEATRARTSQGHTAVPSPDPPSPVHACPAGGMRVLLAEDHPVNQKVAARMLERLGHRVVVVGDGRAALDALETPGEAYDVVLMDVQMPVMDGFEALAALRSREAVAKVPVIALTAHAMKGDRERCLAAGFDHYLSKPIHAKGLKEALEVVASRAAALESPRALATPGPLSRTSPDDFAVLTRRCGGDEDFARELATSFLASVANSVESMSHSLKARDPKRLADEAHGVKGASLTLGLDELAEASKRLEDAAGSGGIPAARAEAAPFLDAWERVKARLNTHIGAGA